jgi:hypothetical protein
MQCKPPAPPCPTKPPPTFITAATSSSSHTMPHLKAMHTTWRALPSPIWTDRWRRQQSLQNAWPQLLVEHWGGGSSLMQTSHVTGPDAAAAVCDDGGASSGSASPATL